MRLTEEHQHSGPVLVMLRRGEHGHHECADAGEQ